MGGMHLQRAGAAKRSEWWADGQAINRAGRTRHPPDTDSNTN